LNWFGLVWFGLNGAGRVGPARHWSHFRGRGQARLRTARADARRRGRDVCCVVADVAFARGECVGHGVRGEAVCHPRTNRTSLVPLLVLSGHRREALNAPGGNEGGETRKGACAVRATGAISLPCTQNGSSDNPAERLQRSARPRLATILRRPLDLTASPPPPSRTNWTRLVPLPVLTGHGRARAGPARHEGLGRHLDLGRREQQLHGRSALRQGLACERDAACPISTG
jgi:hypothetical protein